MNKQEIFRFTSFWLRTQRAYFVFLSGLLLIFMMVAYVFSFQKEVISYLSILILLMACFCFTWDYCRCYRHYQGIRKKNGEGCLPQTLTEAYLLKALQAQKEEKADLWADFLVQKQEIMDYYTLWAHQIKIPISAAKLLVGELSPSDEVRALNQELFKIEQYVSIVLSYLRMDDFHKDLVLKKENIGNLVRQSVKKYAIFFISGKLTLRLGDLDKVVITDKKWFLIILEQLLSNAIKYTKQGEINIFVENETLIIKDTGIGIQKSDLSRVFERGFSGFNGRLDQRASGLGLYLSREIAKKLGHELSLSSKLGEGTTVCIGLKQKTLVQD